MAARLLAFFSPWEAFLSKLQDQGLSRLGQAAEGPADPGEKRTQAVREVRLQGSRWLRVQAALRTRPGTRVLRVSVVSAPCLCVREHEDVSKVSSLIKDISLWVQMSGCLYLQN